MAAKLDSFTEAYIACALWSSTDNQDDSGGDPLDDTYDASDLAPEAIASIIEDCDAFQADNAEMLAKAGDAEQNGHDFWLTRNGHGAGFWDRGYPAAIGRTLTDAAHVYGSCDIYIGEDGKLYIQ